MRRADRERTRRGAQPAALRGGAGGAPRHRPGQLGRARLRDVLAGGDAEGRGMIRTTLYDAREHNTL